MLEGQPFPVLILWKRVSSGYSLDSSLQSIPADLPSIGILVSCPSLASESPDSWTLLFCCSHPSSFFFCKKAVRKLIQRMCWKESSKCKKQESHPRRNPARTRTNPVRFSHSFDHQYPTSSYLFLFFSNFNQENLEKFPSSILERRSAGRMGKRRQERNPRNRKRRNAKENSVARSFSPPNLKTVRFPKNFDVSPPISTLNPLLKTNGQKNERAEIYWALSA